MVARRAFLVLGLVGLLVGGGWVYAQQRNASRAANLSAQDYVEIQSLYAKYNQGSDFSDTAMWMSIWADDAMFKPGNQAITGTKSLAEFRASRNAAAAKGGQRRHSNSSILLTPTAEGASGRAYFTLLDTSAKQPVIAAAGYYDDTFVKTDKGWVFKTRILHFDPPPAAGQRTQ
jgi:SnoaL-like domain